ncbi:DNA repair protein RadA [Caldibacillus lycopersici]|uniref:DNA repair protein RadA n=1 Tax=Perspicuibacillus lycopersici TaxID=1325689 RepID=A0AAE3IVG0_9BACI|nr:DNA repair protein RadA [Perspicuibacillus lycopersici]MCU9615256.1 DNA repair protein RadA [Perspicuibacillus lycopersici]
MAKIKTKFTCQKCGYESPKWLGRCPSCNEWNSFVEEIQEVKGNRRVAFNHTSTTVGGQKATPITKIESKQDPRTLTDSRELNRVLGGGIVGGSLVLIGGDPGIGKSTLLLQVSNQLANKGEKVIYISGEESVKQTKLRADRLGVLSDNLYVFSETNLLIIEQTIQELQPNFAIIDSIQTIYHPDITSAPGSVSQVRECTSEMMRIAKTNGIPIFIVGHVTKEGAIAGPRLLEHMVDTVLYFEGERHHTFRILRAVKNRFGSTNEIGIFEMKESGLEEVENPSEIFLEERSQGASGSTVVASMEGTRPILVEIQALISPTTFGNPRRMATGIDHNRVSLLMAVLEKRVGLLLQNQDAYLKAAGGVKLDEPAIDLAVAISIASSFRDQPTRATDCFIGEVGLTGEIRRVSRIEQRVKEAEKLGFKRIFVPKNNITGWQSNSQLELIGVSTIREALQMALD